MTHRCPWRCLPLRRHYLVDVAGLGEIEDVSLFHDVDAQKALQNVGLRNRELLFEDLAEIVDE